ncbi:hypothetical protein LIER_00751 [Lithospermum erythrorhizon]|uniref:Ribosomal protein L20 n=1 Tax=Lithospermum erythrorhizon TaxID=34254 RepID=A0AAV3NJQ3_LITER
MDIILNPFNGNIKRYWRRRKYERLDGIKGRRNMKVVRFGGTTKRSWRFRVFKRLHLKIILSPIKLWNKFKNSYINMMLQLVGNGTTSLFGGKRIPKGRQVASKYSNIEFENRLVFEIYKNLVASMELNSYH